MEAKIEPTKQEKLNMLNERLNAMLAKKKQQKEEEKQEISKVQEIVRPIEPEKIEKKQEAQESESEEDNPNVPKKIKRIKKKPDGNLRKAAGYVWQDKTMEEWDANDYRIFCGNLGNEVTDQILAAAFRRYPSFQKARVVRDKRTGKTRGYGFVSFKQPKDFLAALEEMQGHHIGNRPVKLSKSNWKDRCLDSERNQFLPSDFRRHSKKKTSSINTNFVFNGVL